MSKSFIKSTKAKVLILTILVLTMTTMLFGGYVVSAETNEDTVQDLTPQPRNESVPRYLEFSDGKLFELEITAANYIWPSADRVEFTIDTRDGNIPRYSYYVEAHFFDINDVQKEDPVHEEGTVSTKKTTTLSCGSSWAWACDYVEYNVRITYNGEVKSDSGRLYFWD